MKLAAPARLSRASRALVLLPRELFHYKPNARWGESYAYLAKILYPDLASQLS